MSLAFARVRPQARELEGAVAWLTAHRTGTGWRPHKAKGPALAALASYYGHAQLAEDRYRLTVTVNDTKLSELNVTGATAGAGHSRSAQGAEGGAGRTAFASTWKAAAASDTPSRFRASLATSRPTRNRPTASRVVSRRVYYPAPPELDGKVLPTGFGVAVNPETFENVASQVAAGRQGPHRALGAPQYPREHTRMGARLPDRRRAPPRGHDLDRRLGQHERHVVRSRRRRAHVLFRAQSEPGRRSRMTFTDICPASIARCPPSIKSAYEPGRFHLGAASELRVRQAGEPGTDPYKPDTRRAVTLGARLTSTPGRFAEAGEALEPLFGGYTLRDDIAKDAARMLLLVNIKEEQPRKIVTYFEVVKEKAPELILTFNQLLSIGKAYREIKEYERAMIVWRGLIEASYLEDARVGELLRQRGKTLEAIAYLVDLWRSYPEHRLDRKRLLRSFAARGENGGRGVHQPRPPSRAGRRRGHAIAVALAVDPHDSDLPGVLAQEPGGR